MGKAFTESDRAALLSRLQNEADEPYRKFHSSLLPGVERILGVRMPKLRVITRELLAGDWAGFLSHCGRSCYEETLLEGLVIAAVPLPYPDKLARVEGFLPAVDNWAVCDYFCNGLDVLTERPDESMAFLERLLQSDRAFGLRVAVVCLLWFFTDAAHIERILALYGAVRHEDYYVKMGVAWAVCEAYTFFPEQTMALLESDALDDQTHRHAIRKIGESRRVPSQGKARARGMRRA